MTCLNYALCEEAGKDGPLLVMSTAIPRPEPLGGFLIDWW